MPKCNSMTRLLMFVLACRLWSALALGIERLVRWRCWLWCCPNLTRQMSGSTIFCSAARAMHFHWHRTDHSSRSQYQRASRVSGTQSSWTANKRDANRSRYDLRRVFRSWHRWHWDPPSVTSVSLGDPRKLQTLTHLRRTSRKNEVSSAGYGSTALWSGKGPKWN